jgi:hypothetical protein
MSRKREVVARQEYFAAKRPRAKKPLQEMQQRQPEYQWPIWLPATNADVLVWSLLSAVAILAVLGLAAWTLN